MPPPNLNSSEMAGLIDKILETKDPATVGLRKILREKKDAANDFPMTAVVAEDFTKAALGNVGGKVFTDDEKRLIELEKNLLRAKAEIDSLKDEMGRREKAAHRQGVEEGREAGKREGHTKATTEFNDQISNILDHLHNYLREVELSRRSLITESYGDLLQLLRAITKKVINAEIATNNDIIIGTLKKALTYIADRTRLRIRVALGDLETVTGRTDFWTSINERLDRVTIEPDERITRGGCIVESAAGIADARIETQVEGIDSIIDSLWHELSTAKDFPPETQEDLSSQFFTPRTPSTGSSDFLEDVHT